MKFLIPPAKELQSNFTSAPHHLPSVSLPILEVLAQASVPELEKIYGVKTQSAQIEAQRIADLEQGTASGYPALELFNGLMYRNIDRNLTEAQRLFTKKHVYITSAFYGIISALDVIAPHRLDFQCKVKIDTQSLKNYWRPIFDNFCSETDEIIVSLLSNEFEAVFSPSCAKNFIRVTFHEEQNGQLKAHSTISKKARGRFLSQVIKKQIQALEDIKNLRVDGFDY
ncbi:peroxide stress protein YaaA [Streptococcus dentasini]